MNQFGVYMYILINFLKFLIVIERDWRRKEKCPFIVRHQYCVFCILCHAESLLFSSSDQMESHRFDAAHSICIGTQGQHLLLCGQRPKHFAGTFNSQSVGRVLWPTIPSYWCLVPDFSPAYLPPARRPKNCYNGIGIIHKAKSRSTIYIK